MKRTHPAMTSAVLFDLGNTLVAYYRPSEFPPILESAMAGVFAALEARKVETVPYAAALQAAVAENREAADFRVTPLVDRLERILGLRVSGDPSLADMLCRCFLAPIFAAGRVYDDTLPALGELRSAGLRTAIVSNTPWGSEPSLWREELSRLGLTQAVDCVVFCGDVGWRKPSPRIFAYAAARLGVAPEKCTFVGDEPSWDIEGSRAAGMNAVLIDRDNRFRGEHENRIGDLRGIGPMLNVPVQTLER